MEERRRTQRLRTYLGGQIAYHPRCPRVVCLVRNLSPNGARLVFQRPVTIPEFFDLSIAQRGDHRHVKLIWRSESEAGVRFEMAEAETIVSAKAADRIRELEAQRDALARRLLDFAHPA